jgi:predicted PurR-regulated permease PerM
LALSTALVLYLFSPFMYVLLFAVVVVVVTWPVFVRVERRLKGRTGVAAMLTTALLGLVVFGPVALLAYLFVNEALAFVGQAVVFVQSGKLNTIIDQVLLLEEQRDRLPAWIRDYVPEDLDIGQTIGGPLQDGVLAALNAAGGWVPEIVSSTVSLVIGAVIFVFAVLTLFMEGPRVLRVIKNLSPMDDSYEERLFAVFAEFSNNLVVGAIATAAAMGTVAGVGYVIAGVERALFFAILTGLSSLVPVVGTTFVWVPLAVYTGATSGWEWGVFVAVWSIFLTGQVDTFVRPLFMRGKTNIHPLLIFLAVFGGIAWMGVPGSLVGPVLVAFCLALYTIFVEDYLGQTSPPRPPPRRWPAWMSRTAERLRRAALGASPATAPPTDAAPADEDSASTPNPGDQLPEA